MISDAYHKFSDSNIQLKNWVISANNEANTEFNGDVLLADQLNVIRSINTFEFV